MKTYLKTLARTFKKHITRLLSILFIVLVSVGFTTGIGMGIDKIEYSLTDYYKAENVSDFIVKSTAGGFSEDDIEKMILRYGRENVNAGFSCDVFFPQSENGEKDEERQPARLYFFCGETTVNTRKLVDGELPKTVYEAGAEEKDKRIKGFDPGAEISLDFKDILTQLALQGGLEAPLLPELPAVTVKITSVERSPLTFGKDKEPSFLNDPDLAAPDSIEAVNALTGLDDILYLSYDVIPEALRPYFPVNDLYISIQNKNLFSAFSKKYTDFIKKEAANLSGEDLLGEHVRVLTLEENYSFSVLHGYAQKVLALCWVLMAVFVFVTALVTLSTMTRLLDEERSQIACLRTLGYGSGRIIFKYLLFAAIGVIIGGVGGYFAGLGVSRLFYVVFNFTFTMPPMSSHVTLLFFIVVLSVILVVTLAATAISGAKLMREAPANLLRPKVPKAGKKVIIERIPFLWNLLSFKYKSTTRNVLRFKSRFFMTVVAVAFSTALVVAGLALLDVCMRVLKSPPILAIAVVVVVFAGLLTATVVYTLTNINISERNRELATLMVLGYYDGEVAGYIYREVFIDSAIGALCGLPLSLAILKVIFNMITAGSISTVSWWVWLASPAVALLFTGLVALILRRKIVKVDMNESLKAIE